MSSDMKRLIQKAKKPEEQSFLRFFNQAYGKIVKSMRLLLHTYRLNHFRLGC